MTGEGMVSRRRLLGTMAVAASGGLVRARPAHARRKTLRIMQWRHFIPSFDPWFNGSFAKEWGEANDTDVIVDNVGFGEIASRARAEIDAREGHDLIQFVTPHAMHCDHLINHREIFEECARRYGQPEAFAVRANYNEKKKAYLGFAPAFQPALAVYRGDLWQSTGTTPSTWTNVLAGARQIRLLSDSAVGLSLAPEHNGEQALRTIMYSFGAAEQTAEAWPSLASPAMREALAYVKSLFEAAMSPDMLAWDGASNNRFMLSGEGCFTIDSLSIVRASEAVDLDFGRDLRLGAVPAGPAARLGSFGFYNYSIWRFASNQEGAKQFLVDYVGRSREAFLASRFQNMPCYGAALPNLAELTGAGSAGGTYSLMKDIPAWTTNVGHLGGTNPAVSEVYERGIVARMFADVATGRASADAAMELAAAEAKDVYDRWSSRGWV